MKQLKNITLFILFIFICSAVSAQKTYKYETVPDDPLNARIYTLDNGLKVFLTVYKDAPRIQCFIPVKVGSKNDPKETTGLAHYFEHMMFKGTPDFGTTDWEKEKVLIDQIEQLFEQYRVEKDEAKRAALYKQIDELSYKASEYAIPNEYDKLMKYIGSQGTNAGTSNDYTIYIENVPSNQLENWALIQSNRFKAPVLRLFHTELETVYEEKNMSLTNDGRRANEAMMEGLYPNHPYGQQTTLGSQEHLRNPSMKSIREFYDKYYVANNMAICLSGDFDFDQAIAIIDKYFSTLPSRPLPEFKFTPEAPVTKPVVKEVVGLEAENVTLAFRMDEPANSKDRYILQMLDYILSNGKAGLLDLNLNQKQLVLDAYAYYYPLVDNSAFILYGKPKSGQSLDDVKALLLEQLELVKQGKFDDWLMEAVINNMKLTEMRQLENNNSRAMWMARAFMNNIPWSDACRSVIEYGKVTKADIVSFVNKHFNANNYVIVYKRQGKPDEIAKVEKPPITPIVVNRDGESKFFSEIKKRQITPIQPVFVDFKKEITFTDHKKMEVMYLNNKENKTFSLTVRIPAGELNDLRISVAADYIDYLGTSNYTAEQIQQEFFKYACNFNMRNYDEYTDITLSGLGDNFEKALNLAMHILYDAQPNEEALKNLVDDILKKRQDARSNQNAVLNALRTYCEYGPELTKYFLTETQLRALTGKELTDLLRQLTAYKPQFIYYGTENNASLLKLIDTYYKIPAKFATPAPAKVFDPLAVTQSKVFFAPYDAKQARLVTFTRGNKFDKSIYPIVNMYNQYFGGGMNAIVFQEMREKRSLAYTAQAMYVAPAKADKYMYNFSFIATQNDKVIDAFTAFNELFNDMPKSQNAFDLAKEGLKTSIETNRITKTSVLWSYIRNMKLGYTYDYRKDIYDMLPKFTLDDVVAFNAKYVKDKPKTYMILSREEDIDFSAVEAKFGKVTKLTLEEIFGY